MLTLRQLEFFLCLCSAAQVMVSILFDSGIKEKCLFLFPPSFVITALLFVCSIDFAAAYALRLRGHHPTVVLLFVTVVTILGLIVVAIVVASMTTTSAWNRDQSCLVKRNVCPTFQYKSFRTTSISPIESGCCAPPAVCGFHQYRNDLFWGNATNVGASPDCRRWDNDQETLCFNCDSCRKGVLVVARKKWFIALIISVSVQFIISVLLFLAIPMMKVVEEARVRETELQE